jgi:hypothetical protein
LIYFLAETWLGHNVARDIHTLLKLMLDCYVTVCSRYVLGDHHKFLIIYRENATYGLMDVNAMLMVPSMSSYLNSNLNFAFGFKYKLCVKC